MTFKKAVATRKKAPFFKTNIYVDHHSQHTSTFCPTSLCSTWADFVIEENSPTSVNPKTDSNSDPSCFVHAESSFTVASEVPSPTIDAESTSVQDNSP